MKILRSDDHKQMPWKNGGGVTVEIAIHPADATVDNFDWRISTAKVAEDGAFSVFADIDRTLAVLDGNGIVLSVDGVETKLTQASEPYSFAGDAPTSACLIDGKITDLNVMTRRGVYTHTVTRIVLDGSPVHLQIKGQSLLFVASGSVRIQNVQHEEKLFARDCARFDVEETSNLQITGEAVAYLISFKSI
ncbi:HutD/Ves family protein [Paenochrobactrum pullorum]|uniref:HutD/Ves family protein n=1 Tax=Paenochrobactrum pullorum TaxID=1324351 RepID=UPI0035BC057B